MLRVLKRKGEHRQAEPSDLLVDACRPDATKKAKEIPKGINCPSNLEHVRPSFIQDQYDNGEVSVDDSFPRKC